MTEHEVLTTADRGTAQAVLRRLLVGADFCAINYGAGFSLEVARSHDQEVSGVPLVVRVTIRSDWRVGDVESWAQLLAASPWPDVDKGEHYDPMRAYALVWLCGGRILDVHLAEGGGLSIATSYGRALHLSGSDAVFEESWIIDIPPGVPGYEQWSVVCSDTGALWSRYPTGSA